MKKKAINLSLLILVISLLWLPVCYSQQAGPEEIYQQYRQTLSSSSDFDALTGLLSNRTLKASYQYIEKLKSRGISEAEAKSTLFRGRQRAFKYEKSRKKSGFHQSGTKAVITFVVEDENIPNHFSNKPSVNSVTTIEKTIEEVHLVNENGWKLDRRVIKPFK
ncbi:MAG: hypothetical protein JAY94_17530 [Candidatus Thiodiazotropha endolucinida]|nr:hypothetical protein [Candidatus Thiodiazotropha taylori]MCW4319316.1 hypothetical protein [Candidatus Thiodiazotropha taylori]